MSVEPSQGYCCATSKNFLDTLFEMALNISDIEQKIRDNIRKKKKKKTQTVLHVCQKTSPYIELQKNQTKGILQNAT